jgi:phenylalanyl-tRNA synthetase beta chain
LIPGLLETMRRNVSIQEKDLKIFEVGKIFLGRGQKNQPKEVEMAAGLWTGLQNQASWHLKEKDCDFYDIKGVVEALLDGLGLQNARFSAIPKVSCGYVRPGYVARILLEDKDLGLVGEIGHEVLGNFDLKQPAFIFELNLEILTPLIPQAMSAQLLPKFPSVSRDITMIIGRDIEALDVLKTAEDLNEKLVENIHLFDIYNGDPIPEGKKSISFRIVYRSIEKTLEYGDVKSLHTSISEKLIKKFDAMLPA